MFFFIFFSLVLNLFYRRKSSGYVQRKLLFAKVPVGVGPFPGGEVHLFTGGSNYFFPIETHITCDFPGGPDPLPPLDRPMWFRASWFNLSTHFSLFFFNITFANSFVERGGNVQSAAVLPLVVIIKY